MMLSDAQELGVYVFGTGRSDMPNQVNNSSVFPGFSAVPLMSVPDRLMNR